MVPVTCIYEVSRRQDPGAGAARVLGEGARERPELSINLISILAFVRR
jgi:hypothetical protein